MPGIPCPDEWSGVAWAPPQPPAWQQRQQSSAGAGTAGPLWNAATARPGRPSACKSCFFDGAVARRAAQSRGGAPRLASTLEGRVGLPHCVVMECLQTEYFRSGTHAAPRAAWSRSGFGGLGLRAFGCLCPASWPVALARGSGPRTWRRRLRPALPARLLPLLAAAAPSETRNSPPASSHFGPRWPALLQCRARLPARTPLPPKPPRERERQPQARHRLRGPQTHGQAVERATLRRRPEALARATRFLRSQPAQGDDAGISSLARSRSREPAHDPGRIAGRVAPSVRAAGPLRPRRARGHGGSSAAWRTQKQLRHG